jgi:hypothetical protein
MKTGKSFTENGIRNQNTALDAQKNTIDTHI